jgi:hypothetical protein
MRSHGRRRRGQVRLLAPCEHFFGVISKLAVVQHAKSAHPAPVGLARSLFQVAFKLNLARLVTAIAPETAAARI